MKKITLLSILAAMFAALSLTSCNTGDDSSYTPLTKEQQDAYQMNMAGTYPNMMLYYHHKNDADVKNQTDSVETTCTISMAKDSTINIANFPIAALAEHISNADLKAAIAEQAPLTLPCKYIVNPGSTQSTAYIYACPNPYTLSLEYGGATHQVQLVFTYSQYYYGVCDWNKRQLGFQFALYAIYVDGKQTNYISNSVNSSTTVSFSCQPKWTGK